MKTTGTAAVLMVLAVWLGYYVGQQRGVQEERRAWLATKQEVTLSAPSVAAGGRILQRPRNSAVHTFYSDPHSARVFIANLGPPPVNVPDPRDTLTQCGGGI